MLSATYTIADVKIKLVQTYDSWGYASDADYETAIESVADDVMRIYFYPRIGQTSYETVAAKDKSGLAEYEVNLYWAEIYSICYEMLKWMTTTSGALSNSSEESLTVEGYSYKTKSSSGSTTSTDTSIKNYFDKMATYWKLVGFNLGGLSRTCTIWGDSDINDIDRTIIE